MKVHKQFWRETLIAASVIAIINANRRLARPELCIKQFPQKSLAHKDTNHHHWSIKAKRLVKNRIAIMLVNFVYVVTTTGRYETRRVF